MSCGCGRNSNRISRSQRLENERKLKQAELKKQTLSLSNNKSPITDPAQRSLVCKSCPYGSQTGREIKSGIFVCHKTNLLINNIVLNTNFNCPVGKWN
jgi:hypothetical protein